MLGALALTALSGSGSGLALDNGLGLHGPPMVRGGRRWCLSNFSDLLNLLVFVDDMSQGCHGTISRATSPPRWPRRSPTPWCHPGSPSWAVRIGFHHSGSHRSRAAVFLTDDTPGRATHHPGAPAPTDKYLNIDDGWAVGRHHNGSIVWDERGADLGSKILPPSFLPSDFHSILHFALSLSLCLSVALALSRALSLCRHTRVSPSLSLSLSLSPLPSSVSGTFATPRRCMCHRVSTVLAVATCVGCMHACGGGCHRSQVR